MWLKRDDGRHERKQWIEDHCNSQEKRLFYVLKKTLPQYFVITWDHQNKRWADSKKYVNWLWNGWERMKEDGTSGDWLSEWKITEQHSIPERTTPTSGGVYEWQQGRTWKFATTTMLMKRKQSTISEHVLRWVPKITKPHMQRFLCMNFLSRLPSSSSSWTMTGILNYCCISRATEQFYGWWLI